MDADKKHSTNLFLQRHHQDAPHLQQVLHVVLVVLLHPSPTVHPVILTALWRNLQTVSHHKGRLAELKSERRDRDDENYCRLCKETRNYHRYVQIHTYQSCRWF